MSFKCFFGVVKVRLEIFAVACQLSKKVCVTAAKLATAKPSPLASGTGPVARVHASSGHPSDNLRIWGSASFMSWGVKCNKSVQIHKWIPRKIFKFHQNLTQQCPKEDFLVMSRTLSSASMLASPTTGSAVTFTSWSGSPPFKHLHGSLPMTPEQTCETTGSNLRRQHKKSLKCVDFWHQFWPNQLHQYAGIIL